MPDENNEIMQAQESEPPAAIAEGPPATASANEGGSEAKAWGVAIAGWLIPGLGHALQRMWGRALAVFLCVGVLVVVGASMRGNLFTSNGNDAFDTLGYVADLGSGSFYFLGRAVERNGADVSHAGGDYGTRFLATAGVLNLLAALHAYEAARGRKA
ncbi:MAG TPA: DUF6677 family protein [Verrucomicrobiae bacterium]|nr:DUF6677 family protein [Verrucomicrobiae bacterium]